MFDLYIQTSQQLKWRVMNNIESEGNLSGSIKPADLMKGLFCLNITILKHWMCRWERYKEKSYGCILRICPLYSNSEAKERDRFLKWLKKKMRGKGGEGKVVIIWLDTIKQLQR